MKALKHIITKEEIDFKVKEVTLLMPEDYMAHEDIIPAVNQYWWLRDFIDLHKDVTNPGPNDKVIVKKGTMLANDRSVSIVNSNGFVQSSPAHAINNAIRPVVEYAKAKLNPGDKVEFAGMTWTVLNEKLALADKCIGEMPFCANFKKENPRDYETSDVKKRIDEWAKENKLI